MKKSYEVMLIVLLGLVVFIAITLLPYIFTKEKINLVDEQLRDQALKANIKAIPKNYEELFLLLNTKENPLNKNKIALGKKLFNDKKLSNLNDISCASCHILKEGGDDNIETAIGHLKQKNPNNLNTPTVLNSALNFKQFYDARVQTLEEQAKGPIQAHFEMNMTEEVLIKRLRNNSTYVKEFQEVFDEKIDFTNITKALAAYEKTLLTRGKIDEFLEGNNDAISEQAKRGFNLFITQGCKGCHSGLGFGGQSIQRFPLKSWWNEAFNLEFVTTSESFFPDVNIIDKSFPFENKGGFLGFANSQKFKVPVLRNITKTSPYFHNGAIKELDEVVNIMGRYQLGINFTKREIEDIVEFLKTLEGELVLY